MRTIRILNQRFTIEDDDYEILKWFIERTNCKVDVADIVNFKVEGPPDLQATKEKAERIQDTAKQAAGVFDNNTTDFDTEYS